MHQAIVIENAKRLGQQESGDAVLARQASLKMGEVVHVRLQRFDPSRDDKPYYEDYEVPYSKLMRVLDALNYIVEDMEEDLGYRWYCGVKKCGTCAVRMNGREILACWEPAEPHMVIEPLRHVPLLRDLAIDREPYEKKIVAMMPWLQRQGGLSGLPRAPVPPRHGGRDSRPQLPELPVLLLGMPGPGFRRGDRVRRPGAFGAARPAGARPPATARTAGASPSRWARCSTASPATSARRRARCTSPSSAPSSSP